MFEEQSFNQSVLKKLKRNFHKLRKYKEGLRFWQGRASKYYSTVFALACDLFYWAFVQGFQDKLTNVYLSWERTKWTWNRTISQVFSHLNSLVSLLFWRWSKHTFVLLTPWQWSTSICCAESLAWIHFFLHKEPWQREDNQLSFLLGLNLLFNGS